MSQPFAYDAVEYPTAALPQAHPGHLHAIARMFGLDPAPAESCRYLELGCGDGMHLIAAALGLPGATFVGIDLSTTAIERGQQIIAELRLANVSLYSADLTTWAPPERAFDYVIAHGLYSWVPAVVRDALLTAMSRCLRPSGIGYVSYNCYPGCFIRRMVWEMMRLHGAGMDVPTAKISRALELARFLAAGKPPKKADSALALLGAELEDILEDRDPRVLYHDDLGAVNEPVYFHEFAAHAGRFGLRFVAEAEPHLMETRGFPSEVAGILNGLAAQDVLAKEQYIDFLLLRRFRQTLLSPDGGTPREDPDPIRIESLFVSGHPKPEDDRIDLAPGVPVTFRAARDALIRTDLAIGKAAMMVLAERWPARLPFTELVRRSVEKLGRDEKPDDTRELGGLLTATWMSGLIELNAYQPHSSGTVTERPVASPLARLQVKSGPFVSTLLHNSMRFDDAPSRLLLQLLDGTRTHDEIAADVAQAFPPDQRPDPAALKAGLERNLERLAKMGLLVG